VEVEWVNTKLPTIQIIKNTVVIVWDFGDQKVIVNMFKNLNQKFDFFSKISYIIINKSYEKKRKTK
jgi:hypothetical protein